MFLKNFKHFFQFFDVLPNFLSIFLKFADLFALEKLIQDFLIVLWTFGTFFNDS